MLSITQDHYVENTHLQLIAMHWSEKIFETYKHKFACKTVFSTWGIDISTVAYHNLTIRTELETLIVPCYMQC